MVCLAEKHKPELEPPHYKPYFTVNSQGFIKLESRWINAMRKTKNTKARSKRLDRILKQFAATTKKHKEENKHVSAEWLRAKYDELVKEGGRPATDWVCKLGPDCWILYYCVGCDTAPIGANQWYRCTFKLELLNQCGLCTVKGGHWRCAICLEKFQPKNADRFSLFVIGKAVDHFVAFIGDAPDDLTNDIQLLKSLTLVRQIGDIDITTEVILDALRELNEEAENHLGGFPRVRSYRAKDPSEVQGSCFAYGEDPTLSIMKTGAIVRAFDLSTVKVRTMTEKFMRRIIKTIFACMDLEPKGVKFSAKQNKVLYHMMSDPVVREFRQRLVDVANRAQAVPAMAGSSADASPPPQPPWPQQPPLSDDETSK